MSKEKVFYGRVSTMKEEQDSSIVNQEQYFNERGINKGYIDRGSGTSIDKRPKFQEMLKECGLDIKKVKSGSKYKSVVIETYKDSKINYIYTKSISRFARSVRDTLEICEMLKKKKVYVIFEDINKSTEDESFFMTMSIMAIMAENESREKSRSIRMGSEMTAKQGKVRSVRAYGYKYNKEDNTLTAIPEEAEIIKKMFELRGEGFGGRVIANKLNELGFKPRTADEWRANVINKITKNPIYYGATARNRYECNTLFSENNHRLKAEDEWILTMNNKIDAIIDKETFDKAQEVRKKYTTDDKTTGGKWTGRGELSGKIICEQCLKAYTKNKDTKIRDYGKYERIFFNCSTKKRKGKSACDNPNVPIENIEKLLSIYIGEGKYKRICENFINMFINKSNKYIDELNGSINKDNKIEIENNENKILELKEKLTKIISLYIEGTIPKDILDNMKEPIEKEIKEIEKINYTLSVSDEEIVSKIQKIESLKKQAVEFVNTIPNDITREDFIEEYLIRITVKKNGDLRPLTKIHALTIILNKIVGVVSDKIDINELRGL